jgi:hypothetical protein
MYRAFSQRRDKRFRLFTSVETKPEKPLISIHQVLLSKYCHLGKGAITSFVIPFHPSETAKPLMLQARFELPYYITKYLPLKNQKKKFSSFYFLSS